MVLASTQVSLTRRSKTFEAGAARQDAESATPPREKRKLDQLDRAAKIQRQEELASVRNAIRHGPNHLRNKAWRAVHGVRIGAEWQGRRIQTVVGGVTSDSVYKKTLNECLAFCEAMTQCVAWSWHKFNENCVAMSTCTGRVRKRDVVSGTKASFDGVWVYKAEGQSRFSGFYITVEKNGEMTFENAEGEYGTLHMVHGAARDHNPQRSMDEWEVRLDAEGPDAGTIRLRLTDGKIKMESWQPEDHQFLEATAEKKEVRYESYDRVTIKEDQVINASEVWVQGPGATKDFQFFSVKKGDTGTVDNVYHPRKTGVSFDQDPGKTVWVNDNLLVKSATLKEVTEEEVKYVYQNLQEALIHAIQDPLTLEVFRDPVIASDGYTYERSAIEQLITNAEESREAPKSPMTREPLSSVKLSTNFAMRSLVSSVVEKVDTARSAAGRIQRHYRGYRVRSRYLAAAESRRTPVTTRKYKK